MATASTWWVTPASRFVNCAMPTPVIRNTEGFSSLKHVHSKAHRMRSTVRSRGDRCSGACTRRRGSTTATTSSATPTSAASATATSTATTSGYSDDENDSHKPRCRAPSQLLQLSAEENEGHTHHHSKSDRCGHEPSLVAIGPNASAWRHARGCSDRYNS
jgi:hypothetical protein